MFPGQSIVFSRFWTEHSAHIFKFPLQIPKYQTSFTPSYTYPRICVHWVPCCYLNYLLIHPHQLLWSYFLQCKAWDLNQVTNARRSLIGTCCDSPALWLTLGKAAGVQVPRREAEALWNDAATAGALGQRQMSLRREPCSVLHGRSHSSKASLISP